MTKYLTRKKAIELCIELWTWCAKTGLPKEEWPEWDKYRALYGGYISNDCWFCAYDMQQSKRNDFTKDSCHYCPLPTRGPNDRCGEPYYPKWRVAKTKQTRQKYAQLFLGQIKELK